LTTAKTYVLVLFMSGPNPYLAELADLAMDLARDMARRAKLAKADADAANLVLAFERLARSVRLCRLLDQRLQQDRLRASRETRARVLDQRHDQLKAALCLAIEDQAPSLGQAAALRIRLSERLEHDRLFETLAQGPLETHIARLRDILGLDPDRRPGPDYLPCPEEDGGGEPLAERSEERAVEGANPTHSASSEPPSNGQAVLSNHEPHEPHERGLIPADADDSS
jgi:hypothetical protein